MSQIRRLTAILAADVAGYSRLRGADEAAASSELTEIAGVDAADGLHRVGGNLRLYRAMLQQYAEDQAETPAALRAALADGDAKTAERLAHTLKGVSATLGINTAEGSVSQRHCPRTPLSSVVQVRSRLPAGGRWIRTSGSAPAA